jgi:hypothetical protein
MLEPARVTLDTPGPWLSAGAIATARAGGGPDAVPIWSVRNGIILSGQGTAGISFQAGGPGPLAVTCSGATVLFEVLPPPRAETFAPARAHPGESFPVALPAAGIRSWMWEAAGAAPPPDPLANPIVIKAESAGTIQLRGTVLDQAGSL